VKDLMSKSGRVDIKGELRSTIDNKERGDYILKTMHF
jgi:hypothetical protein